MQITPSVLDAFIRQELLAVSDERVVASVQSMLVAPYRLLRNWDYGDLGQQYPCWMVLNDRRSGAEIAYCAEGFGPKCPWGLVSSGAEPALQSMGMDSGWFSSFLDAYFESRACTGLSIWRVFQVDPDGKRQPLTEEGDWDATWAQIYKLRELQPMQRFDCHHSIVYGASRTE